MNSIATRPCSAEQAGILNRNAWRCVRIGENHVRINPSSTVQPAIPAGPAQYTAAIEIMDSPIDDAEIPEQEAIDVIRRVFGDLL